MSILNLYHMKLWHELKSTVKFIHKTVLRLQYAFVLCYNYVLILKLFTIASNVVNFFIDDVLSTLVSDARRRNECLI